MKKTHLKRKTVRHKGERFMPACFREAMEKGEIGIQSHHIVCMCIY